MKKILNILLFLILSLSVQSATFNSIQNGDWNNDNTWDGSGIPKSNGDVIHIYHDVIMTGNITFSFDSLIIHPGGSLIGNYKLTVKSGCYLGVYNYLEVCDLVFTNVSVVYVNYSASLQVNCDLTNNNNSDDVTINGSISVDGTFDNGNGGVIVGDGSITADTFTGPGTTFGHTNEDVPPGSIVTSNPLPIELVNFDLFYANNLVLVTWTTASENNNDFFTIEKSIDVMNYEKIGVVNGVNSNEILNYEFIDHQPYDGISYYRLKQTDLDGRFEYFPAKSIKIFGNRTFDLYPNPAENCEDVRLFFKNFDTEILVVVNDVYGRELYTKIIITHQNGFIVGLDCMNKLTSGTYIIIATSLNEIYKKKLIIQ